MDFIEFRRALEWCLIKLDQGIILLFKKEKMTKLTTAVLEMLNNTALSIEADQGKYIVTSGFVFDTTGNLAKFSADQTPFSLHWDQVAIQDSKANLHEWIKDAMIPA